MINQQVLIEPKGHVNIVGIDREGNETTLYNDHNAIQANAMAIVAHAIAGDNNHIDYIEAFKLTVNLHSASVSSYSFPATNKVRFIATFDYADFNDTLDELKLTSSTGGVFSIITNLAITKNSSTKLRITWDITFTDCAGAPSLGDFNNDFNNDFN